MPELVVFDTNVWISGLIWRGAPYRCLLLARARIVQAVYCLEMLSELSEKLRQPFGFSEDQLSAVLYDYKRSARRVAISGAKRFVTGDSDDDKFVECALVAGAALIVSSDHHLLELGQCEGVEILRPAQFLERFSG